MLNRWIFGAEMVWSLCWTDVLNWEGLCGTEGYSSRNNIHSDLPKSGGATFGPNGYVPEIWKKVVYAEMTFSGGTRLDLYPFKEKIYPCSKAIKKITV